MGWAGGGRGGGWGRRPLLVGTPPGAFLTFIKSDGQAESEPIRGRIVDVINYMLLFWLMVSEEK